MSLVMLAARQGRPKLPALLDLAAVATRDDPLRLRQVLNRVSGDAHRRRLEDLYGDPSRLERAMEVPPVRKLRERVESVAGFLSRHPKGEDVPMARQMLGALHELVR